MKSPPIFRFNFVFMALVSIICIPLSANNVEARKVSTAQLYLVSVGNGDPDNITLRAINTIKDSQMIFCDKTIRDRFPILLQGKDIHDPGLGIFGVYGNTPEEVKKNKRFNYEEKIQEYNEINSTIRQAIKDGKTVSILDFGDPTIYGPNMWYMEAFEDLNPEIIPGISSFNAANAALKKGVTSGGRSHSVILTVSGDNKEYSGADTIEKLAANQATMVLFTMFLNMEEVVGKLKIHYPGETPIALVSYAGYREKEKIVQGTLDTILDKIKDDKLPREYLIYVGDFLSNRFKKAEK